jgi:hypothetical protein
MRSYVSWLHEILCFMQCSSVIAALEKDSSAEISPTEVYFHTNVELRIPKKGKILTSEFTLLIRNMTSMQPAIAYMMSSCFSVRTRTEDFRLELVTLGRQKVKSSQTDLNLDSGLHISLNRMSLKF